MAKMVDIEQLKPLLNGIIKEESEATFLEGLMGIAVDYDEDAVNTRINDAVEAVRAEEQANYSKKLHDMFFGGGESGEQVVEDAVDDTKTDPEVTGQDVEISDIFVDDVN